MSKRHSLPNLQSPLNFLYLMQTGLSVFFLMQLRKGGTPCAFAWPEWAAVGCVVQALAMNAPICSANGLPCEALGIE